MMQKKSILAVLFVVLLTALTVNGAVADEEVFTSGDYQYRILEDGTAEITRYSGEDEALKIPETLDGKTVTSIGNEAFSLNISLTSIELPDGVTSMGANPFKGCMLLKNIRVSTEQPVFAVIDGVLFNKAEKSLICYPARKQADAYRVPQGIQQIGDYALYCSSLTSIELPDSVTSIGGRAFGGCNSLTSIELPDSVTSMGANPFVGCELLKSILVSSEQPAFAAIDGVLFNKAEKSLICYPAGKQADAYKVPQGIQRIGDSAFMCCSSLTSIELPDSVTSIGDSAFWRCESLTSIELPDSVTSIGDSAFWQCESLTNIELPDGLTSIRDYAFSRCRSLASIELPNGVTSIGNKAFWSCVSLTSIELPDSVTNIGDSAFDGCFSLTSVELPDGLTSIGDSAFWQCESLTNIELPDGLTSIRDYAFSGCFSLTSVELPESVTSVGIDVFKHCDSLTLTVPHDSYAAQYAKDNGLNYTYPDANDWLNN